MNKRFRFLLVLLFVGVGVLFLLPTVRWYFLVSEEQQQLALAPATEVQGWAREQGDAVLTDLLQRAEASDSSDVTADYPFLRDLARDRYRDLGRDRPETWTAQAVLAGYADRDAVARALEDHFRAEIQELKDLQARIILLGLDLSGGVSVTLEADRDSLAERLGRQPTEAELSDAIDVALEILNNRIDQFGVTEPQIRRADDTEISIEIPGEDDRERIDAFLSGRGTLALHIVDDSTTDQLLTLQQRDPFWNPDDDGIPDFVPLGSIVLPFVQRDAFGVEELVNYIAVRENVSEDGLDGQYITEAQVGSDPLTGRPTVNFILDSEGADIFQQLTAANVNESLAIVLDGRVRARAVITETIAGGQVRVTGFDQTEAQNIATVLRTASLPINLEVTNQTTIGSTLGQETIRAGLLAISAGFGLVILFMAAYYRRAGIVADIALVLNLFFMAALLSAFNLTLTLTSIAGIILTVGIAVDANVIIFERIREELGYGKAAPAAIAAGFQKAFWTVMDANITTFIAAIFLWQLGTGPVRGFALTLAVGIVSSMFTALFVSRLFFDFGTDVLHRQQLRISWRTA